jgi:transposase InsO family protein
LNHNWFVSLEEAREQSEAWSRDYNQGRPHSAGVSDAGGVRSPGRRGR